MPRIDFYVLAAAGPDECIIAACRLVEKAYRQRHRIYVHAVSAEGARRLDDVLWTFRDTSFVPHQVLGTELDLSTPVLIGYDPDHPVDADLLINLTPTVPTFCERYPRVAEFVDGTDAGRRAGRERFRQYRDKGYTLHTHNL